MSFEQEVLNAEAIKRLIESEDLDLLVDSIEGETQLWECLDELHQSLLEDEAAADGIKAVISRLQARLEAVGWREQKKRDAISKALQRLGIPSVRRPTATFSIRKGSQRLEIYNEADIPTQFYKSEPKLQKAALTKALKEGEEIPGCTLVEGSPVLSIRV